MSPTTFAGSGLEITYIFMSYPIALDNIRIFLLKNVQEIKKF